MTAYNPLLWSARLYGKLSLYKMWTLKAGSNEHAYLRSVGLGSEFGEAQSDVFIFVFAQSLRSSFVTYLLGRLRKREWLSENGMTDWMD